MSNKNKLCINDDFIVRMCNCCDKSKVKFCWICSSSFEGNPNEHIKSELHKSLKKRTTPEWIKKYTNSKCGEERYRISFAIHHNEIDKLMEDLGIDDSIEDEPMVL